MAALDKTEDSVEDEAIGETEGGPEEREEAIDTVDEYVLVMLSTTVSFFCVTKGIVVNERCNIRWRRRSEENDHMICLLLSLAS